MYLIFPHPPFHVWRLVSSAPLPPSGLSCCCNVVVYHWMSDANLCFALALCPLLVVVLILFVPPPLVHVLSPPPFSPLSLSDL